MKKLIVLDLDNTLVYATSNRYLPAGILFRFAGYLIVYERPYAKEFVRKCQEEGDVAVFTTAMHEYATEVCKHLEIHPIELFTREDCLYSGDWYIKSVPDYYFEMYDEITIIDDMPEVWDSLAHEKCRVIGIKPFTGNITDDELQKIRICC